MYIHREKVVKGVLVAIIFTFCFAVVALITSGFNHFKVGSQLAVINQVSNLSHLLVRQQANLFSLMLAKEARPDELNEALDTFATDDFILDASLYAPNGTLIAQSQNALPFKPDLNVSGNNATQQIVEPILIQQELAGFLRVTIDAQYGQTTRSKVNALFHLLYGELIILFLVGGLFVSCFYVFRRKTVHIVHPPIKPLKQNSKSQTQRFHSRRRSTGRRV